jgi:dipeptidyl aminopeptidase/acylaminoacyl peptidase
MATRGGAEDDPGPVTVAPYGSWRSPITSFLVASGQVALRELMFSDGAVYWIEGRPAKQGRSVLVRRRSDGAIADVTPDGYSVHTRVHEYGGGSYAVNSGTVYFSNDADQRLYRQEPGAQPWPITPEPARPGALRYADGRVAPDGRSMVCVRERHQSAGEPVNELVVLPTDGSAPPRPIATGHDFFSTPRFSPDGRRLAWLSWDHPNMPWDGTELWTADIAPGGDLSDVRVVAGGPDESIFQPEWSPEGVLHFVSDRTGWWNLYRAGQLTPVLAMDAEFGSPQWGFGLSRYAFLGAGRIACSYTRDGVDHLGVIPQGGGSIAALDPSDVAFDRHYLVSDGSSNIWFIAGSPSQAPGVIGLDVSGGKPSALRRSTDETPERGYLSSPRTLDFNTEGSVTAHALFYPPASKDYRAPEGQRPPLIVIGHGGPTGATSSQLNLELQYWTSRGFAVVDVDYRGSTGYGTAYRRLLYGAWGIADVEDCINAALHLAERGEVDRERLIIRGRSAGGYTTLCALAFHDVFAAGASYYGIGDAEALAVDTHKFESRYCDRLIGPYPEARELYRSRSPVHFADQLSCPIILFQGLDDEVVPPAQAEAMADALRRKGLPFAYVPFEGERHGFRRVETVQRALDAELYFYSRVLGFDLPDQVAPVEIENL